MAGERADLRRALLQERRERDRLDAQLDAARLDVGHLDQVVDETQQPAAARIDRPQVLALRVGQRALHPVEQEVGEAEDRGERRAQLVRHVRQELALGSVGAAELLDHLRQLERALGHRRFERIVAAFQEGNRLGATDRRRRDRGKAVEELCPGLDDARVAGARGDKQKAPHIVADRDRRTRDRRDPQRLGERDGNVDWVERRDEHCRATLEAALDDAQLRPGVERQEPGLLLGRQAFDRGELHALVGLGPASDGGQTGPGPRADRRDQGPGHLVRVGQRCQPLAHRQQRRRHPGLTCEVLARRQELDREPGLRRQRTRVLSNSGVDRVHIGEEHVEHPADANRRADRERDAAPAPYLRSARGSPPSHHRPC